MTAAAAAALSISLLILAAPPTGSIAAPAGGTSNPSVLAPSAIPGTDVRQIGNPSYERGRIAFRAAFDASGDRNADRWPDGWRRRVGPGFPSYVLLSLAADATAPGGHCLRVELNGGGAAAYSPPLEVSPHNAYTVAAAVRTEGLRHDRAYIVWRLLDADQKLIAEHASANVGGDTPWRELTLARQVSDDPRVRFAAVGLYVQPGADRADLAGSVSLAGVRVASEPRLHITTNQPGNICVEGEQVTFTCQVSGLAVGPGARLTIELIDVAQGDGDESDGSDRPVAANAWDLPGKTAPRPSERGNAPRGAASAEGLSPGDPLTWTPRLPGVGCYRVRSRLLVAGRSERSKEAPIAANFVGFTQDVERLLMAEHETTLVVLPARDRPDHRTFGWSLAPSDGSLPRPPPPQLAELAARLGVGAVKLPMWLEATDDAPHGLAGLDRRLAVARSARGGCPGRSACLGAQDLVRRSGGRGLGRRFAHAARGKAAAADSAGPHAVDPPGA